MFEWDERKRQWTISNWGVDFAELTGAFGDPAGVEIEDTRADYGERRFSIYCPVNGRLFHVTYTPRGQRRRIISARKANQREERIYEQRRRDHESDPHH